MFPHTQLFPTGRLAARFLSIALTTTALAAQVGLGLAPMRLDLPVQSGQRQSGVLAITNESTAPVRVGVDLLDFEIDETANPRFASSLVSESAYSCRCWLVLNPMEFELAGSERKLVRYSLRVPRELPPGGFHCAVGFTTAPTATEAAIIGMRTNVRVITAIYPLAGSPPIEGMINRIAVTGAEEVIVTMANQGQRVFRALGTLDLLDGQGEVIHSRPFPTIPILPARKQAVPFSLLPGLLQQAHSVRARVDIGTGEIQEASVNLHARP